MLQRQPCRWRPGKQLQADGRCRAATNRSGQRPHRPLRRGRGAQGQRLDARAISGGRGDPAVRAIFCYQIIRTRFLVRTRESLLESYFGSPNAAGPFSAAAGTDRELVERVRHEPTLALGGIPFMQQRQIGHRSWPALTTIAPPINPKNSRRSPALRREVPQRTGCRTAGR